MTIIEFFGIPVHHTQCASDNKMDSELQRLKRGEIVSLGINVIDQQMEYRYTAGHDSEEWFSASQYLSNAVWTFTVDSDDMLRCKLLNPNSYYETFNKSKYPIVDNNDGRILFHRFMTLERIYES